MESTTFINLFLVFFVSYANICEAKPGLLDDFILEDECQVINGSDTCFVGFDEENCNAKYRIKPSGMYYNYWKSFLRKKHNK